MARRTRSEKSPGKTSKRRGPGRPPRHETDTEKRFPGARVIKRYGNRRLYDATASRAVTMDEIAELVRKREDVRVVDGDTGEDLTKRFLVQVLLEQSSSKQLELLPIELLRTLITLKSEPLAKWMSQYLEAGADFLERQLTATGPAGKAIRDSVSAMFPWMAASRGTRSPAAQGSSKSEVWEPFVPDEKAAAAADPMRQEVDELQRRLAELAEKMGAKVGRR